MNALSIDTINTLSPYKVTQYEDGIFCFVTDSSVEIFVCFEKDEILQIGESYQLGISNPKGIKSPRDSKIRLTIISIVKEFFKKNQAGLLYICETGDGMQKMRNRLFKYWFSIYGENDEFYFLPMTIYDEEENENYAALIIRYDNPLFAQIVREFTTTINLLNSKP